MNLNYSLSDFLRSLGVDVGSEVFVETWRRRFIGVLRAVDDLRYVLVIQPLNGDPLTFIPWKRISYLQAWNGKSKQKPEKKPLADWYKKYL